MSFSRLTVIARKAGFSIAEIDDMDISFLQDLLIEEANIISQREAEKDKPKVRKATQADFDAL